MEREVFDALDEPEVNGQVRPEDYRHLEDYFAGVCAEAGVPVFETGQERVNGRLGRWSPDFAIEVQGSWVFADVKIRHRDYRNFLIESAPIHRALHDDELQLPTIFVLVAEEPLQIVGYITAEDAARNAGPYRNDHRGNGSGDWYHLIDAFWLSPFEDLIG